MSKPHLPIKKGESPCGKMAVHWGRKEVEGNCNVCTPKEAAHASRWVALISINSHTAILCPHHLSELQKVIDKLNHPTASRHFKDEYL